MDAEIRAFVSGYQQNIGNGGFRGWLINGGARYVF